MSLEAPLDRQWHIWIVSPDKFNVVKEYLTKKVPEVREVLCPIKKEDRHTKGGAIKTKSRALYVGYVFLKYAPSYHTWNMINRHPFVSSYLGPCSEKELETVKKLQNGLDNDG